MISNNDYVILEDLTHEELLKYADKIRTDNFYQKIELENCQKDVRYYKEELSKTTDELHFYFWYIFASSFFCAYFFVTLDSPLRFSFSSVFFFRYLLLIALCALASFFSSIFAYILLEIYKKPIKRILIDGCNITKQIFLISFIAVTAPLAIKIVLFLFCRNQP